MSKPIASEGTLRGIAFALSSSSSLEGMNTQYLGEAVDICADLIKEQSAETEELKADNALAFWRLPNGEMTTIPPSAWGKNEGSAKEVLGNE